MIACSGCHNTLPDWAQKCQFCGADVTKVSRPAPVGKKPQTYAPSPTWIWPVYYALCAYWIVSGLGHGAETYHTAITPVKVEFLGIKQTMEAPGFFAFWSIVGFALAAFRVVVGIGLAARIELARGIANFLSALSILFGLLGLVSSFTSAIFLGPWAILGIVINTVDIIVGAMTIYLIGETEKGAPNF